MWNKIKKHKFEIVIGVIMVIAVLSSVMTYMYAEEDYKKCVNKCKLEYREDDGMDAKAKNVILDRCLEQCSTEKEGKTRLNDDHNNRSRNRGW